MERNARSDIQNENTICFLKKRSQEHSSSKVLATRRGTGGEFDLEPKRIPKENASAIAKRGLAINC
jgi:hypothetical protein